MDNTQSDIEKLIAEGESLELEFKSEVNDSELIEVVVCLANGDGGTLLIGVNDKGVITGAQPRHGKTTEPRRVEALIFNSTRPSVGARVEVVEEKGKSVIVIRIQKSPTPTGTTTGKYLRRTLGGDGRPSCVPYFVFETGGLGLAQDPSSVLVPGAVWADLDSLEIERFRRFARESGTRSDRALFELSDQDLCSALGGIEANGEVRGIRRLALLLFGRTEALQRLLPTHEIAWQVILGGKVEENEISRVPLLRVFEELTNRFRSRNRSTEIVDLFRTEIPDFSEDAFREAFANALTHRDITQLGAIHVQWTDEGIRIDNPGGLPEGVRLDNLLVTPPRPRNPMLADAFKRAGIVERTGRGVDSIFFGQLRYGRLAPRYSLTDHSVSVLLPGGTANLELVRWVAAQGRRGYNLELPDLLLIRACAEQRELTSEEAAKVLQLDVERARTILARLVDAGFLEAKGNRRGRVYHLSAELYRMLGQSSEYVRTRGFEPLQQEQMVLQYAQKHGQITRNEAAELCRITPRQAKRLLSRMVDRYPAFSLEGERRTARYVWKEPNVPKGQS